MVEQAQITGDGAIVILTRDSKAEIVRARGVGGLTLQPRHARRQRYVVCTRNDRNTNADAGEPHRTAFLVGILGGVRVSDDHRGARRWGLVFDAVAEVSIPDVWQRWRNPVVYRSMSELGIDPAALTFTRFEGAEEEAERKVVVDVDGIASLTLLQAKAGLAKGLGVDVNQIEITIKA